MNVQVCIFDFSLSQLRSILKRSKFQICVRRLYSLHYKFVISFLLETVYMEPRTILLFLHCKLNGIETALRKKGKKGVFQICRCFEKFVRTT